MGHRKTAADEIGGQIAEIQTATGATVEAMRAIGQTIAKMNEIATGIASAVEEQVAARQEIVRSLTQPRLRVLEIPARRTQAQFSAG